MSKMIDGPMIGVPGLKERTAWSDRHVYHRRKRGAYHYICYAWVFENLVAIMRIHTHLGTITETNDNRFRWIRKEIKDNGKFWTGKNDQGTCKTLEEAKAAVESGWTDTGYEVKTTIDPEYEKHGSRPALAVEA